MKAPHERRAAVDGQRIRAWVDDFAGYRYPVTEGRVERWLTQFDGAHHDVAARVLDAVDFIGQDQIAAIFRRILAMLPGWSRNRRKRRGTWRFAPFSGSTGESGDSMLHCFRVANDLDSRMHDNLFIHRSEIVAARLTPADTLVLVDDFSGTGQQACGSWEMFQELLGGGPRVYLLLVSAAVDALHQIKSRTGLRAVCGHQLTDEDNIFHACCTHFNATEKDALLAYCQRADPSHPRGHGNCGFLVVFAHRCPNNTIPVLNVTSAQWEGLFRRNR
jgi:hypothetical protein